ncbi:MAG: mucoidy inhibitor MuiA family protein [Myxococcales bacterium]
MHRGESSVVFHSLPADLDPTTLQAAAEGPGAKVEGVSLSTRTFEEAQPALARELDEKIDALQLETTKETRARDRAVAERAQAEALRASAIAFLTREMATEKKPNTASWAAGLDAVRTALEDAETRRSSAVASLRELGRQDAELRARRDALASAEPRTVGEAEVVVRCSGKGRARVELSYLAGGTSWTPMYEARAVASRDAVELTVLAQVEQATGEAWKGVEVTLSTAATRRDARPPELLPLRLGASPQEQTKKVLVRRDEEVRHVSEDKPKPANPTGGLVATTEKPPSLEAQDQGLSVQLKVPGVVDLAGDGRPTRLKVETVRLPATYSIVAVPKLAPHAFRAAQAVNQARYPLLAGRVDLFSAGSYVGSSRMPAVAQGDRFKLAFGVDESVKVRRMTLEEDRRDPGFLGSTRRMLYGYKVELANFATKPVELLVQEHAPVSQLDDVKVVFDERTTKGFEVSKEDGILTWKLSLAAREKKDLELRFTVEIPARYDSGGL